MSKINKIIARQVFDSRGNPTIETEVFSNKVSASAICPSGASTGSFEAYEKRDTKNKRYLNLIKSIALQSTLAFMQKLLNALIQQNRIRCQPLFPQSHLTHFSRPSFFNAFDKPYKFWNSKSR